MQYLQSYDPYNAIFPATSEAELKSKDLHPEVIQVFDVHLEKRNFNEEQWKNVCKVIMRETHTHIVISSVANQSLTFIVSGKQNNVLAARHRIFGSFHTETRNINIPKKQQRSICETQKKRLEELEKKTGTKIHFHGDDIVKISGPKRGIEEVEYQFKVICAEQDLENTFERISVPKMYHPFICGPEKEKLIAIMTKTGVTINIPPPSVEINEIIIVGEKQGVASAKKMIGNIYKDMALRCKTISVEIPKSQHQYINSSQNSAINDILRLTEVSVEMPVSDSPTSTITLRGPRKKLVQAMEQLKKKANARSPFIKAPGWIQKYIIGDKGSNIGTIMNGLRKVAIEFNVKKSKIEIEGPTKQLKEAEKRLNLVARGLIKDLNSVEFRIVPKYYAYIIRKIDAIVHRMQEKTKGMINLLPNDLSKKFRLEGDNISVRKARTSFESCCENLGRYAMWGDAHEFPISKSFHELCIGGENADIREICKQTHTIMDLPTEDDTSEIITIFGRALDAKEAKIKVQKIQDDLDNIVIEEISISSKIHDSLTVDDGNLISLLMKECGNVKINIPPADSKSDKVTIEGPKYFVEKAKQFLNRTIEAPPAANKKKKKQVKPRKITAKEDEIIEAFIKIDPEHQSVLKEVKIFEYAPELFPGLRITFPRPGVERTRVYLKGPRYAVECMKDSLREFVLLLEKIEKEYETWQEEDDFDFEDDEGEDYDYDEDEKNTVTRTNYQEKYRRVKITAPRVQWGRKRKTPQSFIYY